MDILTEPDSEVLSLLLSWLPCHATPCHAMPCHAMRRHAMPARRRISVGVRHHPWPPVHGTVLLLAQAVRGCEHLPKLHQGMYRLHRFLQLPIGITITISITCITFSIAITIMCMMLCHLLSLSLCTMVHSAKAYLYNDDNFNWNFGISSAAVGNLR